MSTEVAKPDELETCRKCGQKVNFDKDGFCPECGTRPVPLAGDVGTCKQCGQIVTFDKDGFCPKCGTRPTALRGDFETCKVCGQTVKKFDKDGLCPKCGKARPPEPPQRKATEVISKPSGGQRWQDALIEIMCAVMGLVLLNVYLAEQLHLSPSTTKGINVLLFVWLCSAFRRFL
jgi:Zn finger protein HypA/HybF involved in hydrogenase expression